MNIIFLGTAGSGKTSLCNAYGLWLKKERHESVSFVNLDPGAVEYLPYQPDFDIRKYFTIPQIMKKEKLGPNGAILRANELFLENADTFINKINDLTSDFILIDTPGQLEPFIFKESSLFLQKLQQKSPSIAIFLIDAELTRYASNLIVGLLLAIAVQIQIGINMIYIVHKADLLSKNLKIVKMIQNPNFFRECIISEQRGALTDLALIVHEVFAKLASSIRIITTSAKKPFSGLEELHDLIHESFCACGDLT
ncbi:MAG: ATP/GTP-binding protein [Candidatus Helarchaeota archaeon]